ncbi:hypothetical protein JCM9533A_00400 [Catenuloplanes niger JCM 9533]
MVTAVAALPAVDRGFRVAANTIASGAPSNATVVAVLPTAGCALRVAPTARDGARSTAVAGCTAVAGHAEAGDRTAVAGRATVAGRTAGAGAFTRVRAGRTRRSPASVTHRRDPHSTRPR